jgi:hypothetical protein
MKNLNYPLFILLAAILFCYSCNTKDSTSGLPHYTIDADLKAAFNYKLGTYWIYRDSISKRVDSFAVRSNSFSTGTVAGNYTIDGIGIAITEYNGGSTIDTSAWIMSLSVNFINLIWYQNYLSGQEYFDLDPAFNYPFKLGSLSIIGGGSGSDNSDGTLNIFSSFSLLNNTFNDVVETYHSYKYASTIGYYDLFYANADVGFIKMAINDYYNKINKVWEIQRWHIVK